MTSELHTTQVSLNGINNAYELVDRLAVAFGNLEAAARKAGEQIVAWDRVWIEADSEIEFHGMRPEDRYERRSLTITALGVNNGN